MTTGHVTTLGPRRHKVTLSHGTDARGKRVRTCKTFYGTRREADRYLADLIAQHNRGTWVEASDTLYGAYLDQWLRHVSLRLRPSTMYSYRDLAGRYVRPVLGHIPLGKLQPLALSELYTDLAGQGLSKRTVRLVHSVIHGSLKQAVAWRLIPVNVAIGAAPPQPDPAPFRALDEREMVHLFNVASERAQLRDYAAACLVGYTGLRIGECLALRVGDVDLTLTVYDQDGNPRRAGAVSVGRTVSRVGAGDVTVEEHTKTAAGRRRVTFVGEPLAVLDRYLEHLGVTLGRMPLADDLLFPAASGGIEKPENLRKRWHRLVAKAGFPGLKFHHLRHSHASHLIRQGLHMKLVQERLGHAHFKTTADTYSHVLPGMDEEAAIALDGAFARERQETPALPAAPGSVVALDTIGGRVRQAREALGWSGRMLGEELGIARSNVSMIETGMVRPSAKRLDALARVLGVSREWLEDGEER